MERQWSGLYERKDIYSKQLEDTKADLIRKP